MKIKDTLFYKIIRPIVVMYIKICYKPTIIGIENIPKEGRILIAGNHTKWLDPLLLICAVKRQVHFLAKDELFHGKTKFILEGVGAIPVNRKIHDKSALENAYKFLEEDLCVGIFPEGTINRTNDIIMPFKIGAVKACNTTNAKLVPFIITGKYKLFKKNVQIEFLSPMTIDKDLDKENNRFMEIVSNKLIEGEKRNERKQDNI